MTTYTSIRQLLTTAPPTELLDLVGLLEGRPEVELIKHDGALGLDQCTVVRLTQVELLTPRRVHVVRSSKEHTAATHSHSTIINTSDY